MQNLWIPKDQRLLERLKDDIVAGPTLARPDPYQIIYIKTDWSKDRMGVVLMQSYYSVE